VAATEDKSPRSAALMALTAAALALPGIAPSTAHAQDADGVSLEYHHYEEGGRDLSSSYLFVKPKPLTADSFSLGAQGPLPFDDRFRASLSYSQDTWSGATPVTTVPHAAIAEQLLSGASTPNGYTTDRKHRPIVQSFNPLTGDAYPSVRDSRLVDIVASASPETRRQISGKLGYAWDTAALNFGGGFSDEPDYKSYFVNTDGRLDLNQKLTTLNWGASFTYSHIAASLASNSAADFGAYTDQIRLRGNDQYLYGIRHDISANAGIAQILSKNALIAGTIEYTRNAGYLANPYKATEFAFNDPNQFVDPTGMRFVQLKGVLEERPRLRNQWNFGARYIQYVGETDAALHAQYQFFHDDWGIDAHTIDLSWYQPLGDGWMVTPGMRYYTQSAADFYRPFFLFNQAFPIVFPHNPDVPARIDFTKIKLKNYSSDERLSGFGSLSAQLTVSKQLREDLRLEVGADYSYRSGSLKLGSGGAQNYADLHSYTVYASLKFDFAGRTGLEDYRNSDAGGAATAGTDGAPNAPSTDAFAVSVPAGVRFTRLLKTEGDFALSLHHDYGIQGGDTLHGTKIVPDATIATLDCGGTQCSRRVSGAYAHSTTLDILYAPLPGWTLMVTPQFVDLHLDETDLGNGSLGGGGGFHPGGAGFRPGRGASPPTLAHSSGGIGDTGLYVLKELLRGENYRLDAGLGLSLPTGSVNKRVNKAGDYLSYGLQTGSGTVDFNPSITYRGGWERFSWGAQISAVERLQSSNDSGYRLGDRAQGTIWGGYGVLSWLTASVRGIASEQGVVHGHFKDHVTPTQNGYKVVNGLPVPIFKNVVTPQTELGPMDLRASYGGRFGDVGLGLSAVVPNGPFAGNRLSIEWLQPVVNDMNGYQRERTGTLSLTWDAAF
jgi:hypothetical protein